MIMIIKKNTPVFEPKKQDVTWMTFFFFPIADLELGSWIRLPGPYAP